VPNFDARFASGISVVPWDDPASGTRPSRLNPVDGHPFIREVATVGVEVEVQAYVRGLGWAPLDSALGGAPTWDPLEFMEFASSARPVATSPAGQSSVQRFTPDTPGHYTLRFSRPGGGAIRMHIDAQDPP